MSTYVPLGAGSLQKFLKKSLALVSAVVLSVSLMGNVAFAAENDYTVTGGDIAALPVVGAASSAINTITITDAGGDDFGQDPTTLEIMINTASYPNVIFDQTVTAGAPITTAGTCGYTGETTVTYLEAAGGDAVEAGDNAIGVAIAVNGGTVCAAGETITIAGLKIISIFAKTAPAAAGLVTVDNFTDSAGTPVTSTTTMAQASTAGTLTNTSVSLGSNSAGVTTTARARFTNPGSISIAANDKITLTFGAGFNVNNAAGGTCNTGADPMDGTYVTTDAAQVVTLARQNDGTAEAAGVEECTVGTIVTPATTGSTGTYTITVTTSTDAVRYTATAPASVIGGGGGGGVGGGTGGIDEVEDDVTTPVEDETDVDGGVEEGATQETTEDTQETSETTETTETTEEEVEDDSMVEEAAAMTDEDSAAAENNTPFADVEGHWATGYIGLLYDMEVVLGRTETSFAPNAQITRAEIVKIALLTFGYAVEEGATPSFSDVSSSDWYAPYLAAAEDAGIVEGYEDGKFHPNDSVNRAEALKILLTAGGFTIGETEAAPFTDVPDGAWFAPFVDFAYANGIVSGKTATTFAPADNITRAEMSKMAVKAYGMEQ